MKIYSDYSLRVTVSLPMSNIVKTVSVSYFGLYSLV